MHLNLQKKEESNVSCAPFLQENPAVTWLRSSKFHLKKKKWEKKGGQGQFLRYMIRLMKEKWKEQCTKTNHLDEGLKKYKHRRVLFCFVLLFTREILGRFRPKGNCYDTDEKEIKMYSCTFL